MTPIVNGLEEAFSGQIIFIKTNVDEDSSLFNSLGLPGHPSYVLFDADEQEAYRAFGIVTEGQLRAALDDVIK